MTEKRPSLAYRIIRWLVRLLYPRLELVGGENLPPEPCLIVGNHTQMNGPIAAQLYLPRRRRIWCAGDMMALRAVPAYAFADFWSQKPKWTHPLYRVLSYLIAPLAVCVFNNADTVAVYHDARIRFTFRDSVEGLQNGADMVIFPEHDVKHNNIVYDFQERFVDLARLYWKKTGRELCFVPLYIAPRLKKMYLGTPIRFSAETPLREERQRVCAYLMDEITAMARRAPRHTVIPYRNIPKRDYPLNL